jgi:hypothetical protein
VDAATEEGMSELQRLRQAYLLALASITSEDLHAHLAQSSDWTPVDGDPRFFQHCTGWFACIPLDSLPPGDHANQLREAVEAVILAEQP